MGDHIHPDRKNWLAMQTGKGGPAAMSIDIIRERIKATRATGAKAAIYMHLTALDDSSEEFYPGLAVARQVGADGLPVRVPWNGPDVKGGLWWMSMAAPEWRNHLLQQAQWIMEIEAELLLKILRSIDLSSPRRPRARPAKGIGPARPPQARGWWFWCSWLVDQG